MSKSKPVAVSLFSGPGGSSLGYKRAGFDVRVAVDCAPEKWSNSILDTYRANHDGTLLERDVRNVDGDELLDAAGLDVGDLDLLDGSPPCSPFSSMNSGAGGFDHDSGTLFDEYVRLVDETQPRTFVAENVPGLAQGKTKGYYQKILRDLNDAGPGYHVRPQAINPAYLGAGQHRNRLMIMGTRTDVPNHDPIKPTSSPRPLSESWDGLDRDPEAVAECRESLNSSPNATAYKRLEPGEALGDIADKGWSHYRLKYTETPRMFTAADVVVHPSEDRRITTGEVKRICGLPDDYVIAAPSRAQQQECCIRCLPPELNGTIGRHMKRVLPTA